MKDFNKEVEWCRGLIKKLNIPVPFDKIESIKAVSGLRKRGLCHFLFDDSVPEADRLNPDKATGYKIEINTKLLKEEKIPYELRGTILHEFIHTLPGCYKHNGKFADYMGDIFMETGIML